MYLNPNDFSRPVNFSSNSIMNVTNSQPFVIMIENIANSLSCSTCYTCVISRGDNNLSVPASVIIYYKSNSTALFQCDISQSTNALYVTDGILKFSMFYTANRIWFRQSNNSDKSCEEFILFNYISYYST